MSVHMLEKFPSPKGSDSPALQWVSNIPAGLVHRLTFFCKELNVEMASVNELEAELLVGVGHISHKILIVEEDAEAPDVPFLDVVLL